MKCAANIRNFFGKFAVHCKFLVLLSEICSVLQISFCKTDNTFCNLYIREFVFVLLPDTSYSFYCPKHPIVCVYISRCSGYHTDEIHAGDGCLLGVTCQIKHCNREYIRAYQPYHENQDKGYAQFAHVTSVLAVQMAAGYQGSDDGNQYHSALYPGENRCRGCYLSVLHHRYEMKIEALAQDE